MISSLGLVLRCRVPLLYGLTEVFVPMLAITYVVTTPGNNLLAKLIGLLGGIYILVRGLDNMGKQLKDNIRWHRFFWGRKPVV